MHITVCICTFKRPRLLGHLLAKLGGQETMGLFTFSIVVADNDGLESARLAVGEAAAALPVPVHYCVEPRQNIALARNRALQNATGDFVAFIDDDEFPPKDWLLTLFTICNQRQVAGVLGPVRPFFEQEPPQWLLRGKFCERPEPPTGSVLGWRQTRTGNVLFRRRILEGTSEPFRQEFGNGGEDQEFFRRMIERGAMFIWCNEAAVHEIVPPERWKRSYLLRRALLRGQNEKRLADPRGIAKALVAVPLYSMALPFLMLMGQHYFMKYVIRLCDHAGRLMGFIGLKPLGNKYING